MLLFVTRVDLVFRPINCCLAPNESYCSTNEQGSPRAGSPKLRSEQRCWRARDRVIFVHPRIPKFCVRLGRSFVPTYSRLAVPPCQRHSVSVHAALMITGLKPKFLDNGGRITCAMQSRINYADEQLPALFRASATCKRSCFPRKSYDRVNVDQLFGGL